MTKKFTLGKTQEIIGTHTITSTQLLDNGLNNGNGNNRAKGNSPYRFKAPKHVFEMIALNHFPVLWNYNVSCKVYIN